MTSSRAALAVLLAWSLAVSTLASQEPPRLASPPAGSQAAAGEYQVGAGDVLQITVAESPEVTRTTSVQPRGVIWLPLLGEVPVAGLTVHEIQRKLTTLLERDFLVNPHVEVEIRAYQSQAVIVMGEVNTPGRRVLRGRTRLVELLIEAGGMKPSASGDVTITRTEGSFDGGTDTLKVHIGTSGMTPQDRVNLDIMVKNGDLIMVAPRNHVTVEGEIARPARYPIEGELTVTGLISAAGGLTRFGGNKLKLRRVDPETGKVQMLEVDLKAIRGGKKPDLVLLPNDLITVPRKRF